MAMCIELQIQGSSYQHAELLLAVKNAVNGLGYTVDRKEFTPSAETLAELAAVESGRATIKTYNN